MILDPEEPLRIGIKSELTPIGIPIYAKGVPKDVKVTQYINLTSQTLNKTEVSKDCFDWKCSINIECITFNQSGFATPSTNDRVKAQVIDIIQSGISVNGFMVKGIDFIQASDLDIETPTAKIERKVIIYQFWVGQI